MESVECFAATLKDMPEMGIAGSYFEREPCGRARPLGPGTGVCTYVTCNHQSMVGGWSSLNSCETDGLRCVNHHSFFGQTKKTLCMCATEETGAA